MSEVWLTPARACASESRPRERWTRRCRRRPPPVLPRSVQQLTVEPLVLDPVFIPPSGGDSLRQQQHVFPLVAHGRPPPHRIGLLDSRTAPAHEARRRAQPLG